MQKSPKYIPFLLTIMSFNIKMKELLNQ